MNIEIVSTSTSTCWLGQSQLELQVYLLVISLQWS